LAGDRIAFSNIRNIGVGVLFLAVEGRLVKHVLFICSQNRLRSPTAEQVFASWEGIEVASAGLNLGADNPVTPELLEWADLVFVMEKAHRSKLSARFRAHLGKQRIICLDIPDEFEFMEPALVVLLKARVSKHLPNSGSVCEP
jgi:predicted protein tyrosine phosphatase